MCLHKKVVIVQCNSSNTQKCVVLGQLFISLMDLKRVGYLDYSIGERKLLKIETKISLL